LSFGQKNNRPAGDEMDFAWNLPTWSAGAATYSLTTPVPRGWPDILVLGKRFKANSRPFW
tara:strand:+ start:329 stop:508 length:180 start_codon:yes stop_codon:yes gene_type:complete